jgi:uncharacterized repeat protein (TIGR01451 family)
MSRLSLRRSKLGGYFIVGALGLALLVWTGFSADGVHAQAGPDLSHSGIECIPTTQFTILNATIVPGPEVRAARVYFRSDKYPDFYYVDMTSSGDDFQAILPKPSDETSRVFYYLEATDIGYASNRTVEYDAKVVEDENECKRRDPAVAYFTGESPSIIVGAVRSGAPAIPPGFLADGIISAGPGGMGTGAAIGIAAGAAGAVGVGVLATQSDDQTTTTTIAAVGSPTPQTTTSIATTTQTLGQVKACFTTLPDPPIITAGERIKLDGRCSEPPDSLTFLWDLGDGRKRQGPFIEPVYGVAGTFTIELTVSRSSSLTGLAQQDTDVDFVRREITVKPTIEPKKDRAELSVTKIGLPNPFFGFGNEPLVYTVTVRNEGRVAATGVRLVDDYPEEMRLTLPRGFSCTDSPVTTTMTCNLDPIPAQSSVVLQYSLSPFWDLAPEALVNNVEVQASNDPSNNFASVTIPVVSSPASRALENRQFPVELTSYLGVRPFDGRTGGRVMFNGSQAVPTNNASPSRHRFQGKLGKNTVEAVITSSMEGEGFWRFDFRRVQGYVAGSLNAEMGQVIATDGRTVVFRLSGVPNERIRFSFKLVP